MESGPLTGRTVVVAGAGLAGLAAARELEKRGARVLVVEARGRVGGRVLTIRDGFAGGQHAEGGADLIEKGQTHVAALARELGLRRTRILRRGFGFCGHDGNGALRVWKEARSFGTLGARLAPLVEDYLAGEQRWDGAVARALGRTSVARWLDRVDASPELRSGARGLRGFFLADPEQLSLLALVDQFASDGSPGQDAIFRIADGNDRLATGIAQRLARPVELRTILRAVDQRRTRLQVVVERASGVDRIAADYLVVALPASTARDVAFDPPLPDAQREAIGRLRYGAATRVLLQFERRFWIRGGWPRAFGSDLPVGAVWDGNEHQGRAPGILSLLAGGRAAREARDILGQRGPDALVAELGWLGRPARLLAARAIAWDRERWSRGGYAFFDPRFDPCLRAWLARPHGRVVFAGEHTSVRWQGYMNGAVESGLRAAAEVAALESR